MVKHSVKLRVYDLSNGLAKTLGPSFGLHVDGIWHTAIEIYNLEYFFQDGIKYAEPGTTHYGEPVEILEMGETEVDQFLFNDYLESIYEKYNDKSYHLLENNCNHFSDDICIFLVGKNIPMHITDLPSTFINSPAYSLFESSIGTFSRSRKEDDVEKNENKKENESKK